MKICLFDEGGSMLAQPYRSKVRGYHRCRIVHYACSKMGVI